MTDPRDEIEEKLRALGLDPQANPAWQKSGPIDLGKLPALQQQREMFVQIKRLLEAQTAQDQQELLALQEQLARSKRGGGR